MSASAGSSASRRRAVPWLLERVNAASHRLGVRTPEVTFDAVTAAAEDSTGLSNWGDPRYHKRLAHALGAIEVDNLSLVGRWGARSLHHWHATSRLKLIDYLERHPHVRSVDVGAPIIILGGFRTGTTNLHNLLNLDERLRAPLTWELGYPVPELDDLARDRRRRRRRAQIVFGGQSVIIPDLHEVHHITVDSPEECHFLLEKSALTVDTLFSFQALEYGWWILDQDVSDAYTELRAQYQLLRDYHDRVGLPRREWVLKSPFHMWFVRDLLEAIPTARIIRTHRAMEKTVPSTCSLAAVVASKFMMDPRLDEWGRFWTDYYSRGFELYDRDVEGIDSSQLIDVTLDEISRDPIGTVRRVYDHFGIEHHSGHEERIRQHAAALERTRDAPGAHRYDPEDFGLSAGMVRERFAAYHDRYDL